MRGPYRIDALAAGHDRTGFKCGSEPLDRYFKELVSQDLRRNVATCFVAVDVASSSIAGYYTLSAGSVPLTGIPVDLRKKLPRYPSVPVVRMGRLAVDERARGTGLGGAMIIDAFERILASEIGCYALLVDAKDDNAVAFYRHLGFLHLEGADDVLFLPIATGRKVLLG